ncbi:flavodoxin-dependent (E)-4-hydroxy-3-methylbut-2-enyl-diphosphate synthase [Mycoplasma bradburyae]|uniref:4-hydroxy-3-methylbut-2-en-1-yl diphosphate synthase (flavodoxin) n=1 Tax=Mycoplasma bradburyae TaxID=2963128 RepID=A0AAW6HPT3_9MOLU|nr:flavodoxin-dependent (E)-4-hydroxy-3-methylbut-2-enyl-diphosphate synthase [Mycoplasma bradburyae]MDC4163335.1 flavodoxin-dependent (E)-4-hydroxy-3-methylbut-2-enyl-diphosphate synthase [Mycoplasma bradburyae]MDC4181949.1 flavodoxin-dependent (E)-4-hydroxy-3-methylbut-2-enyl-diphosphate synthase [Mycoplasma bradburyae]MDC4182652.1 flavodoxin-dependent (E)-4-hydroxy-3-methylbut-2-enyl-diphosphate synthase [Mycoplasma bradburyae]MDC4183324.1 flavodoxin-dependent (E)-4-hydroxy-3-methylbut-2-eny
MYTRSKTKKVFVGNVQIGGQDKIVLQSMTIAKTKNVSKSLKEINDLVKEGADLVRIAVFDDADKKAIRKVVEKSPCPIIADIHFNPDYAIAAIKSGCKKIRLNPGNIKSKEKLKEICVLAKQHNVPIRVGVNSGSIPSDLMREYGVSAKAMIIAAQRYVRMLKRFDFDDIVISLKTSSAMLSMEVYELGAKKFNYPMHLGITEAGTLINGTIKSVAGLTPLLLKGIGDTIRISLSTNPVDEIKVAKKMLNSLGLYDNLVDVVACPTCGRLNFDLFKVVNEVEKFVKDLNFPLKVSILGCSVNGPGEAKEADIGIAGGKEEGIIFKKGIVIKSVKQEYLVDELKKMILEEYDLFKNRNNK